MGSQIQSWHVPDPGRFYNKILVESPKITRQSQHWGTGSQCHQPGLDLEPIPLLYLVTSLPSTHKSFPFILFLLNPYGLPVPDHYSRLPHNLSMAFIFSGYIYVCVYVLHPGQMSEKIFCYCPLPFDIRSFTSPLLLWSPSSGRVVLGSLLTFSPSTLILLVDFPPTVSRAPLYHCVSNSPRCDPSHPLDSQFFKTPVLRFK